MKVDSACPAAKSWHIQSADCSSPPEFPRTVWTAKLGRERVSLQQCSLRSHRCLSMPAPPMGLNSAQANPFQLSVGTLTGALCAAPVADRIGRKWSISAWCVMLHVGLIVQISAPHPKWYQIVAGRYVAGLGVGALSLLVPMYQSESAPRHIRGALIS
jgi:hypothetical protein